jgi:alpha-beta hydrolase superfamily lysophospholipase
MKKKLLKFLLIITALYVFVCILLFFFQERLIFFPQKLDKDYKFSFNQNFEELNVKASDGILLNGLLFKADSSKGLIFYLHGNAGCLSSWGEVAQTYTSLNYDVFLLDYRGYGKSEGAINSQQQIYDDLQVVYNELKKKYVEEKIIVLGYSIGTGPACKLASVNHPKLLVLQAPYFSLSDMMRHTYPAIIPTFILKYKFETNEYIKDCKMPVVIFHGDKDEVIYYGSSLKLKEQFKKQDTLITLEGQGHNGMTDNEAYKAEMRKILEK